MYHEQTSFSPHLTHIDWAMSDNIEIQTLLYKENTYTYIHTYIHTRMDIHNNTAKQTNGHRCRHWLRGKNKNKNSQRLSILCNDKAMHEQCITIYIICGLESLLLGEFRVGSCPIYQSEILGTGLRSAFKSFIF